MKLKNKYGFTLIELLAVIVVLAIIALIATPIVMNTIKKSQKGAAERIAENYIDAVETAVATAKLDSDGVPDGTYTIDENGNLTGTGLPNDKLTIEMNGNKPKSGTITIKNGQVTTSSKMTLGSYEVAYNPTSKKYEATEKETSSLICDLQEGTSQTVGAKYTCHLDKDRTFYVLSSDSSTVDLLMAENFTDGDGTNGTIPKTVAWCTDGGLDNKICMNINTTGSAAPVGKDYIGHITNVFNKSGLEVSFPTPEQLLKVDGKSYPESYELSAKWLYDNLTKYGENGDQIEGPYKGVFGYLTASYDPDNSEGVLLVTLEGCISNDSVANSTDYGIRPVITISKSQLN